MLARSSFRQVGIHDHGLYSRNRPRFCCRDLNEDASGNLAGTQTRSLNGDVADETFTGNAIVNPDCTGTDVIQVFESGVLVRTTMLNLVYDDNGRAARAIFKSLVLPNGASLPAVLAIEAQKVFSGKSE
ncbi:MAG: hypothetical protein DMG84_20540 [Acidobacteria bacterium]|nr:MAG: hypothetical protein DMG96_42335 [Acidobacteriota bacterium]PYX12942.1 MAG: hypothetical protein DMG84_20540 [Acidobacteriota bacterium]